MTSRPKLVRRTSRDNRNQLSHLASFRRVNSSRRSIYGQGGAVASASFETDSVKNGTESNIPSALASSRPGSRPGSRSSITRSSLRKEAQIPFETIVLGQDGKPVDRHTSKVQKGGDRKETTNVQSDPTYASTATKVKESNLVQALCYQGLEVIFSTSTTIAYADEKKQEISELPCIQVITTRTRRTLQTLTIPSHAGQIVTMSGNPHTGYLFVATSNKYIFIYSPIPTQTSRFDAKRRNSGIKNRSSNISLFGKLNWTQSRVICCQNIFDSSAFSRPGCQKGTGVLNVSATAVHISSSQDLKVLVANADQLAIFDLSCGVNMQHQEDDIISNMNSCDSLVWTKSVGATITNAVLSGDGKAIAYVLEGEGVGVPFPYGVRTMVRDRDDGSQANKSRGGGITPPPLPTPETSNKNATSLGMKSATSVNEPIIANNRGIVFKSGPFLVHSTTVTRLSFRGNGVNYCNNSQDLKDKDSDEGNDLLMTSCSADGSMRVFSQGAWKLLLHWDTPPGSRADWIEGITMCNLGDLDPYPKSSKGRSPSSPSRTNSAEVLESEKTIRQSKVTGSPTTSVWQSQPIPTSAAGGWIAELTFRGPFPALRLSRLSFLKSGGDSWAPAHFESVAAILPPSTLLPDSILQTLCGDENTGMSVQGIWPAWNPWELHPHSKSSDSVVDGKDDSLDGDAMSLLGAVPRENVIAPVGASTGLNTMHAASLGGTHSPPSELRLVASHPNGKVIVMEFPLWGDDDFGAMELGSPLRYLINLKEEIPMDTRIVPSLKDGSHGSTHHTVAPLPITTSTRYAHLNFESNGLCAMVSDDRKSVNLIWRKPGTMNIIKSSDYEVGNGGNTRNGLKRSPSDVSIASTISMDSNESHSSFQSADHDEEVEGFTDWSAMPLPLSLPPLLLPSTTIHSEKISLLKWWPAENYGGLPKLFALTTFGTLILYEMPPPWAATEPLMPFEDPFALSAMNSLVSSADNGSVPDDSLKQSEGANNGDEADIEEEYEVQILPHPDFGLGLRLEAQADGMPATAGSFKKHPLSGGRLPAEKTGKIVLGDELIAVNDISLIGMSFDDIISTVRTVGMDAKEGGLLMKFRRAHGANSNGASQASVCYSTVDQGLEVIQRSKIDSDADDVESGGATVLVGAEHEMQQEFGRVVATIKNALPSYSEGSESGSPRSLVLLPWNYGKVAPVPYEDPGATMLVSAIGRKVTALRLELCNSFDPETNAQLTSVGSVDIEKACDDSKAADIISLEVIKTASEGWCVAACDELGDVNLVFIDISDDAVDHQPAMESPIPSYHATFRTQRIFNCFTTYDNCTMNECLLRASSIEVIATMPIGIDGLDRVNIWTSTPSVLTATSEEARHTVESSSEYVLSTLYHVESGKNSAILDFRWIASGSLDAFPWLVTFGLTSAVVHRRSASSVDWVSICQISYISSQVPKYQGSSSPADAFPHLLPAVRTIVSASDERNFVQSDWHPDSILAYICTTLSRGVDKAINGYVRCLFKWLSQWLDPNDSTTLNWNSQSTILCAPITSLYADEDDEGEPAQTSSQLMTLSHQTKSSLNKAHLLEKLQLSLSSHIDSNEKENIEERKKESYSLSKDDGDDIGENDLPESLKILEKDDLCLLRGLGELVKKKLSVEKYDKEAQLTMFCVTLLYHIQESSYSEPPTNNEPNNTRVLKGLTSSPRKSYLVKQPLYQPTPKTEPAKIASAACLSALLSNSQGDILETCRNLYGRINWSVARSIMLPYWIRSNEMLKRVSEEIAQSVFKETKDVMECALFYIAAGNIKMLRAIAATDRSISGKKFLTFITSHDFSSTRGRTAAEKNAYSLLRKRKYMPAAAFFLLAKPPMLKSAIEIIATNMEDFTLAFFISRLMDMQKSNIDSLGGMDALTIGGGMSLTGMGGGGGFASGGYNPNKSLSYQDETTYEKWEPKLQNFSLDLLVKRGIPYSQKDPCLQATCFIWLCRPNDAILCISNRSYSTDREFHVRNGEDICPSKDNLLKSEMDNPICRVMCKANLMIDFCSRPHLLKRMKVNTHVVWSSSIMISRALKRRGLEISSILALPDEMNEQRDEVLSLNRHSTLPATLPTTSASPQNMMNSSIFDSFAPSSMGQSTKPHQAQPNANDATSSIFDSFDVPVPKPKHPPSNSMGSSIFDSYDAPTLHKKVKEPRGGNQQQNNLAGNSDPMASSIFDSFDAPAQKPKPAVDKQPMESSIFDSFDAPVRKPKPPVDKQTMESSIFDSFDAPVRKPKPPVDKQPMQPSIFDSFDAPNSRIPPKVGEKQTPAIEETMNDSIICDKVIPLVWIEWRRNILITAIARRLIREIARIIAPFEGDVKSVPNKLFRRHIHPLVSYGASRVLQESCDGEAILSIILDSLDKLCSSFDVPKDPVVEQCLLLLGCPSQPRRIVFAVLLHCLTGRADLAEDVIRDAANDQVQRCQLFSCSNDDLVFNRKTVHHSSTQYVRQEASIISWQLELCMWLHRGGAFPMTSLSLKETTAAVRIGYVVASWGRCHECLENIIKCEPDCVMDHEHGRQLWGSMKVILGDSSLQDKNGDGGETTSGGWEFLVDCKRAGATEILRNRKPGTFLLRPHPEDHGVFTLSFRTNLMIPQENDEKQPQQDPNLNPEGITKRVKRDEVVQHAIVRLSDAGFRCGSFGPFSSLLKLLEAVSKSLPFDLLFSEPPVQGIIKEEGAQPSPNAVFIRKLALHSKTEHYRWNTSTRVQDEEKDGDKANDEIDEIDPVELEQRQFELGRQLGMFSQLLVLTELRKQFSAIISNNERDESDELKDSQYGEKDPENYFEGSLADDNSYTGEEDLESAASRTIRPLLDWCRTMEVSIAHEILPSLSNLSKPRTLSLPIDLSVSETAVEMETSRFRNIFSGGDNIIRRMIQPNSGVEFRTLRVGEGGHSAVVVLFRRQEAISWLISSKVEKDEENAIARLEAIQQSRVIEEIDLNIMNTGVDGNILPEQVIDIRYRFVDPWEVEVLESKDAELRGASLGRGHYIPFSIGAVARACEETQRRLGGLHLLSLWNTAKGGISLTKALASAHPPWEADCGSDLHITNASVSQSSVYDNSIHQYLYRNALFRELRLPQRFLALIQVELLDLKNLTSPAGAPSLTAYALLRLKRTASNAPLTHKARTLDSACTEPRKILSISGPNAPASWGSLVRFRFPLPEGVNCNGVSIDDDREALFKGVPRQLQISVYEKKFMNDMMLGGADVKLDSLSSGGQVEEWVPLRSQKKDGITWFARVRLTLRFELMCLAAEARETVMEQCPSAGMKKIHQLSRIGGAHEDAEGVQRSVSTPDFVSYLESIVY